MTTKEIISLAKEKLGKDISEQEAQDYLDGKITLPDEALEVVSGGQYCAGQVCDKCGRETMVYDYKESLMYCESCWHSQDYKREWQR